MLVVRLVRPSVRARMRVSLHGTARAQVSPTNWPSSSRFKGKCKGSPDSITERRVLELIPVLGSQLASDVSHKPGGRLPLLSAKPAVTPTTLKRASTSFAAW